MPHAQISCKSNEKSTLKKAKRVSILPNGKIDQLRTGNTVEHRQKIDSHQFLNEVVYVNNSGTSGNRWWSGGISVCSLKYKGCFFKLDWNIRGWTVACGFDCRVGPIARIDWTYHLEKNDYFNKVIVVATLVGNWKMFSMLLISWTIDTWVYVPRWCTIARVRCW